MTDAKHRERTACRCSSAGACRACWVGYEDNWHYQHSERCEFCETSIPKCACGVKHDPPLHRYERLYHLAALKYSITCSFCWRKPIGDATALGGGKHTVRVCHKHHRGAIQMRWNARGGREGVTR